MNLTEQTLLDAVGQLIDPNTQKSFASAKAVKSASLNGGKAAVKIELSYPARSQHAAIAEQACTALRALDGVTEAFAEVSFRVVAHTVQNNIQLIPNVRNVIAVSSGKGGVGKSTTAVNLALALAQEGARVGILDADIYGPSVPQMLGLQGQQPEASEEAMHPLRAHGLQANSIGFLIDVEQPMVWRGPMATSALRQLLTQTQWEDLDYLIIDMPPGTGDIQLTLAQSVPVTGAIVVTTPQDIALLDARKGLKMFEKVGIPILGIVENMSIHVCSNCGHAEHIFGSGGGEKMCADYKVPFLGSLPLDIRIRQETDSGQPTVIAEPDSAIAQSYRSIARQTAIAIAEKQRDMRHKFPNIVVQNT